MRPHSDIPRHSEPDREHMRHWLVLHRTPGIGIRRLRKLLALFESPAAILEAPGEQLRAAGVTARSLEYLADPDWDAVEADLAWSASPGNRIMTCLDPGYPALLQEIADPPVLLFVHGDHEYLTQPQLAIVGSRNPSHDGRAIAREFAAHLASCGLTVTSGLAAGIDGAAHEGALQAGAATVAVTATGLDRVYPASHRELAHRIAENGVLVSEFPPGTAPVATNFPRRNRIISGLSLGTLVVEAALHSGSLITARSALEQGREVFAIPGSIHNPLARGCHALIREGAKLVETADHILEELASLIALCVSQQQPSSDQACEQAEEHAKLSGEYQRLLDLMGYAPVSVDQLVDRSGLTPEQLSSMLLALELQDYVLSCAGGRYTRAR